MATSGSTTNSTLSAWPGATSPSPKASSASDVGQYECVDRRRRAVLADAQRSAVETGKREEATGRGGRPAAASAALLSVVTVALVAYGAGDPDGAAGQEGELSVVATTTHIADLARAVGGVRGSVDALLTPSSDPDDFEPRPSDVRALGGTDLVLRSGGDIDRWLGGLIDSAGARPCRS